VGLGLVGDLEAGAASGRRSAGFTRSID